MELIDKSALVAEIERRISDNKKDMERASHKFLEDYFEGYEDALTLLKQQFLDTLKVKEVDLEKEAEKFVQTKEFAESKESPVLLIAKHFYELGLTQKGE